MTSSGERPAPTGLFDMAAAAMTVVDNLNDAVVIVDDEGRILYLNRSIERMLEWDPAALLGQPVSVLVPERLRAAHQAGFDRFLGTRTPTILGQPTRLPALTASGNEHLVELVLTSLALPDGTIVIAAALRDVADRIDLERQSALANQLLQVLTRDLTMPELVQETIAALGRSLDMPAAAFWAPSPDGGTLRCEAFWRRPGEGEALEAASWRLHVRPGEGLAGR
jgi:phosphoserine phosphatase RsbU/P